MGLLRQITPPILYNKVLSLVLQHFSLSNIKQNQNTSNNDMILQLHSSILFDGHDDIYKKELGRSNSYGEYGCGQSTIYAINKGKSVISAETDKQWVELINSQLSVIDNHSAFINHIDLGPTGRWGSPLGYSKRYMFRTYTQFYLDKNIDLLLIDGRFRVACFLQLYTQYENAISIIIDDYPSREYYHIIEDVVKPEEINRRQALFRLSEIDERINIELAKSLLPKFEYVMS